MVYKPKKTVTGHKRNDRTTRRRKRARASRKRAAAAPVRSNIKRYVAEQFGKTHPDNRYYLSLGTLKPTNVLADTPRYYPFGATFQRKFLTMEFNRMKEVVSQFPSLEPKTGGIALSTYATNPKVGDFNHWRSLLGRGIHMKNSSVYGTITLNETVYTSMLDVLKYGNLKLHMFVLEDKAVTKTEFLNWYKDLLSSVAYTQSERNIGEAHGPSETDFDKDLLAVPYVAGSRYPTASPTDTTSKATVTGVLTHNQDTRPSGGFEEFLLDWEKFYKTDATDNPEESLFYNEVKCTTDWDGTRARSLLPVNKSRFIVHEHKTWSFKPKANGCVDTVIPFEYSIPEHYMTYDKELLDMPFIWNTETTTDAQGLHGSWLYPRKQPYIVFVYTCDNPHLIDSPSYIHQVRDGDHTKIQGERSIVHEEGAMEVTEAEPNAAAEQEAGELRRRLVEVHPDVLPSNKEQQRANVGASTTVVPKGEIFEIDMHFKCSYENKLATSIVPTINKGRPIIHKRESAPASKTPSRPPKRDAPMDPISRKYRQTNLKDVFKVRRNAGPSGLTKSGRGPMRPPEAKDKILPATISPKSAHARDQYYLDKARQTHDGLYVRGNFLYIYGTRTKADAAIRWPQIAAGNVGLGKFMLTARYKAAQKVLKANPHIKTVVGHSYGATTAWALTRNFNVKGRAYGSPVARVFNDPRFQTFRHRGDPVSILDFAAKTSKRDFEGPLDAHSYKYFDGKYLSRSDYASHDEP